MRKESLCPASRSKHPEVHSDETDLGPLFTFRAQECHAAIGLGLEYEPCPELVTEAGIRDTQIGLNPETGSGVNLTFLRMGSQGVIPVKTKVCYQEEG